MFEMTHFNHKHGHSGGRSKLYRVWISMRSRCRNPNHTSYKDYGARGIDVCAEWDDYDTFRQWAEAHGYDDGMSIERVDVDGGYNPQNCAWIPMAEQSRNTRRCVWVELDGERMLLKDAARKVGAKYSTACYRMRNGWSVKAALGLA